MMMSASRVAARKPSPKYMIGSIMDKRLLLGFPAEKTQCHAAGASSSFPAARRYPATQRASERGPGRPGGEFEIAEGRAPAHPYAGAGGKEDAAGGGEHRPA